jgi:putative ABC transport system ATP-binding protein
MNTIECRHISRSFGEGSSRVEVLKDINFSASSHEMIMLMGPSGSGKTTLLSIMGGILRPSEGTCLILGNDLASMDGSKLISFRGAHIGFIFQNFALVPTLNAIENAALPLLIGGVAREKAFFQAAELLLQLGLDSQRYRTSYELSGGEQQRVAIARACIHKPSVIFCDEPTSFLDRERGIQIMELLRSIKNAFETTIVVVTHDPRILYYADRILEIEDGRLLSARDKKDTEQSN